ncbi:MAG TPA: tetratricopeptide repeat-containing glycosyltransferase family protein [Humisphaera sp.]|jgi:Flp pilus assembly protein TadD|nr:tetratricopeptide repeat-containing glycosyltransferase family protein [Humisphaera sp.]
MNVEQLYKDALEHERAGRAADAERLYRQVLAINPEHSGALNGIGVIAMTAGHFKEAAEILKIALRLNPREASYHGNLGMALANLGDYPAAMASYRQALALRPDYPEALNNFAAAHLDLFQFEEAIVLLQKAVKLRANFGEAYNNLGNALREKGRVEQAIEAFRQAAALRPNTPKIIWNLAWALLLTGDFQQGLAAYESRWNIPEIHMHREFKEPLWDGSPLAGKHILLHEEQGLGDTIQFIRYVPLVKARGGDVTVGVQPALRRLLTGQCGIDRILTAGGSIPAFAVHAPFMSLPRLMGTTQYTVPADMPYLRAEPALSAQWKARLANYPGLKVGVVWAGSAHHTRDKTRSIRLEAFAPLAQAKNVTWISLQKGDQATQPRPPGLELLDWTQELDDFADTAGLIDNLDLVIAVDTAVAHLAGAMGKKTWVLIPFAPDWRWMTRRNNTPWYPTMRLFRQPRPGDWKTAIEQIARELQSFK